MIKKTDDIELREEIEKALIDNNGYCPCRIERIPENRCMCKDFREQKEGVCHCGLYVKT